MYAPTHIRSVSSSKMRLYPALCLTKRVDWTINASMDLGKALRETEGRLSINSLVTVCDSRPRIKATITHACCDPKHSDQRREREAQERSSSPQCQWMNMDISKEHLSNIAQVQVYYWCQHSAWCLAAVSKLCLFLLSYLNTFTTAIWQNI